MHHIALVLCVYNHFNDLRNNKFGTKYYHDLLISLVKSHQIYTYETGILSVCQHNTQSHEIWVLDVIWANLKHD